MKKMIRVGEISEDILRDARHVLNDYVETIRTSAEHEPNGDYDWNRFCNVAWFSGYLEGALDPGLEEKIPGENRD